MSEKKQYLCRINYKLPQNNRNMKDVFISYSRKDMAVADKICAALDRAGITYFIDKQDIGIGHPFADIAKAIKECTLFLYLGSYNAYMSIYAPKEINYAVRHKAKNNILPYLIDDSPMPDELDLLLCDYNWRTTKEHPIDSILIKDLLKLLGRSQSQSASQSDKSTGERYLVVLSHPGYALLPIVKRIKELLNTGLKEAKDIVDAAPTTFPREFSLSEANTIKQELESLGAKVSIQQSFNHTNSATTNNGNSQSATTTGAYLVVLSSPGANKLHIVKAVKEILNLGLKEAKDIVDAAPSTLPREFSLSEANTIKQRLEEHGATVFTKQVSDSEKQYYIEIPFSKGQSSRGFDAMASYIYDPVPFNGIDLQVYSDFAPCILPVLFDEAKASLLQRIAAENGTTIRMIPYTPQTASVDFKLLSPEDSKLQVVKYLKEHLDVELTRAKEYVDSAPAIIASSEDFRTTKWFTDGLREIGAIVSIQIKD